MDSDIGHCAVLGSDDVLLITKDESGERRGEKFFRREINLGRGRMSGRKKNPTQGFLLRYHTYHTFLSGGLLGRFELSLLAPHLCNKFLQLDFASPLHIQYKIQGCSFLGVASRSDPRVY